MIEKDIIYTNRPVAIPFGYSLPYKLALLCMIISKNCESRKSCPLVKLQLIITTLLSEGSLKKLIQLCKDKSYILTPVRFDPSINKALVFGIKDGVIKKLENGNYKLTELGKNFVEKILKNKILEFESKELLKLGILDDQTLEFIISTWRYDDKN